MPPYSFNRRFDGCSDLEICFGGYEDLERKYFAVLGKVLHFSKRSSEGTTICAPPKAILLFSFCPTGTLTSELTPIKKLRCYFFFHFTTCSHFLAWCSN